MGQFEAPEQISCSDHSEELITAHRKMRLKATEVKANHLQNYQKVSLFLSAADSSKGAKVDQILVRLFFSIIFFYTDLSGLVFGEACCQPSLYTNLKNPNSGFVVLINQQGFFKCAPKVSQISITRQIPCGCKR